MIEKFKFKQIYNTRTNRLQNYDYSLNGGYFITICTKDKENYFGEIVEGEMILNDIGEIVSEEIIGLKRYYNYLIVDEFVVMPNHLHLILILFGNDDCRRDVSDCRDVSEKHLYEDDKFTKEYYSNISPKKGTIGNIIKLFKGFTTKKINKSQNKTFFSWQPNYYDRIIRNENELNKIRKYISENPIKWQLDKNNTENIFM